MPVSIWMDRGLLVYCCVVACMLGAVFGSFLNCAAWRIAHGESFLRGRSHCPACGHTLSARDLVPVLSWLFRRGRCRYCGEKISARYPLTELAFALLTVLCLLRFDLTVVCLRNWVFLCCLFCLSLVDLESYTIPDGCLLTALGAWLLALPLLRPSWAEIGRALLAGLVFGGGILLLSVLLLKLALGGKLSLGLGGNLGFGLSLKHRLGLRKLCCGGGFGGFGGVEVLFGHGASSNGATSRLFPGGTQSTGACVSFTEHAGT